MVWSHKSIIPVSGTEMGTTISRPAWEQPGQLMRPCLQRKSKKRPANIPQGFSICLASLGPSVQFPMLHEERRERERQKDRQTESKKTI